MTITSLFIRSLFPPGRIRMRAAVPTVAACLGAFVGACGSSVPRAMATGAAVRIDGEFLADGSCRVTADGVPLFSEGEKPRTTYLRGRALNMAPSGYEVHEIWCAPMTAGQPMLPAHPNDRAFFINVYPPTGKLAAASTM